VNIRAASGHAAAAPTSVMSSRRFTTQCLRASTEKGLSIRCLFTPESGHRELAWYATDKWEREDNAPRFLTAGELAGSNAGSWDALWDEFAGTN